MHYCITVYQGPSRCAGTDSSPPPLAAGESGGPGEGTGEGGGPEDEEEGGRLQKYAEAGHAPAGARGQLGDGRSRVPGAVELSGVLMWTSLVCLMKPS